MDVTTITEILISLFTLTALEIVLGVDNLVFISIVSGRVARSQQKSARRVGLLLALFMRLLLLFSIVWLVGLKKPFFTLFNHTFSIRDVVLVIGGLFLLYKGTQEIHAEFENHSVDAHQKKILGFTTAVLQIALLDIVFSLDSVITAVGLTQTFWIMALAILIAVILMLFASEPLSRFVQRHPTVKMLALSFLLLIGTVLIADGFSFHVPREYVYFALCFSMFVESLNTFLRKKKLKSRALKKA